MRSSEYTEEIGDMICEALSTEVVALKTLCQREDFPSQSVVYKWLNIYPSFVEKYTRAREAQADLMAEQILEIADATENDTVVGENGEYPNHEWINRSKLRVDARKWLCSKILPKKYGDRVDVTSKDDKINNITPEALVAIADKINKNAAS